MGHDDNNKFTRLGSERFAARQRNHEAFAEKIGELIQNIIAAGMPVDLVRDAFDRGMQRGIYLRDNHQSEAEVIDIKR
jgi:nicotinamidase-related amidase